MIFTACRGADMHKVLLLLGLLRQGPLSGYDLHRIVRAHGELYTDLKKGNVYYLLDRLAGDGYLHVEVAPGAGGPRGERLLYSLTDQGAARFEELLRAVLRTYDTVHPGVDVAIVFLAQLPRVEALTLLAERRQTIETRRALVQAEFGDLAALPPLERIAADHLLSLMDAELAWVDRALAELRRSPWAAAPTTHESSAAQAHTEGSHDVDHVVDHDVDHVVDPER
jgi:DNA-binding PadR family transcriptional regulator